MRILLAQTERGYYCRWHRQHKNACTTRRADQNQAIYIKIKVRYGVSQTLMKHKVDVSVRENSAVTREYADNIK